MGQAWYCTGVRTLELREEPDPPLGPDQVRLRTLYSGISAGTELTYYRGTNASLHRRWDRKLRLYRPEPGEWTGAQPHGLVLGYEEVGEVVEVGREVAPEVIKVGDRVQAGWGHRTMTILPAARAAAQRLPPTLDPRLAVLAGIGTVSLNGVLDAAIRITEWVAVFGLGVVGQLTVQLALRSGGRAIAVDPVAHRRDIAARAGALHVFHPDTDDVAYRIRQLTDGKGADVCIEAAARAEALHLAIKSCAYSGRVIVLAFHQGEARGLDLGEEFHLNRIAVISSQNDGVSPELSYRWDRARKRVAIMDLLASGQIQGELLMSHVFPFDSAPQAFELLDQGSPDVLQVVLECPRS